MAKAKLKESAIKRGPKAMERTPTIKLVESNRQISSHSALDKYWTSKGFMDLTSRIVPNAKIADKMEAVKNYETMIDRFSLFGIGYGNWVTQEDRFNYQTGLYFSLMDLQRVLLFPKENLGLFKSLSITFGARGIPKALAHFEPANDLINLARYMDNTEEIQASKVVRFMATGGMGAFAHEYGHFLDYWFGKNADPVSGESSLTDGRSTAGETYKIRYTRKNPHRLAMAELMQAIIFANPAKGTLSMYYKYLLNKYSKQGGGYFLRHNEIFARLFEVHVFYELKRMGIKNAFLTDTKYEKGMYLPEKEYLKVRPKLQSVINLMRLDLRQMTER